MPYFYYFMIWFVIMSCQLVITPRLTFSGIYPDFVLAASILLGLKRGWKMGLWFGFAFGLSMDLTDPLNFGWVMLTVSLSGLIAGIVREKIYVENNLYQVGIVAAITFVYYLVLTFIESVGYLVNDFGSSVLDFFLIALYTALVSGAILLLLQQRYRLRELL